MACPSPLTVGDVMPAEAAEHADPHDDRNDPRQRTKMKRLVNKRHSHRFRAQHFIWRQNDKVCKVDEDVDGGDNRNAKHDGQRHVAAWVHHLLGHAGYSFPRGERLSNFEASDFVAIPFAVNVKCLQPQAW